MTTSPFDAPAPSGGKLPLEQLLGSLLIFEVLSYEPAVNTALGIKPAVKANVYAVDGPMAGTAIPNTLVFPVVLMSQLQPKIGRIVLGRLGQGTPKPGQDAPWTLSDPTPEDTAQATAFWQQVQAGQFAAPAQQQPPAGPNPATWSGQGGGFVQTAPAQQQWSQQPQPNYGQPPVQPNYGQPPAQPQGPGGPPPF